MEKRSTKIIAIVALFVAVVGLSLGFAAFSSTLTIESGATVNPDSDTFNVDLSTSASSSVPGTVAAKTGDGFTAGTAGTISNNENNNSSTLSGLSATFTEPGQTVVYELYAFNAGEYIAYLTDVVFDGTKECVAVTDGVAEEDRVTPGLINAACESISMTVDVTTGANKTYSFTGNQTLAENATLAKNSAHPITVTITYANPVEENAINRVDGPIEVTFPDVVLTYKSVGPVAVNN